MYPYDPNTQPPQQPGQPWQPGQPQPNQWPPQQQPPYTQPYAPPGQWQQPGQQWPPQQPMQPPPPKKKRRIWLWVVVGIVALMFCSVVSHATQSTTQATTDTSQAQATTAPTPTPTQDPTQLPAYQLASIDAGGAPPDNATVAKYQTVLDDLHKKTGDPEQNIADETVEGQKLLAQHNKAISLYDLASAADKAIPPGTPKMSYAQVLAALITLMTSNNQ